MLDEGYFVLRQRAYEIHISRHDLHKNLRTTILVNSDISLSDIT